MSRPWMPLYVADYLADTRRLSTLEHGAYLLLIMEYWQRGGLPDDDEELAQIAGLSPKEWGKIRAKMARLFLPGWRHKRVDEELAKASALSDRRRASAERRWSKHDASADANAYPIADANGHASAMQEICVGDAKGMHRAGVPQPQSQLETDKPPAQRPVPYAHAESDRPEAERPPGPGAAPGKSELDQVEAACRTALGEKAPLDVVVGPIVEIVRKFGQDRVSLCLASEARRTREKPIRTWKIWARVVDEQLTAAAPTAFTPPPAESEKIRLKNRDLVPKSAVLRAIERWNSGGMWNETLGGPPGRRDCALPPEMLALVTIDAEGNPFAQPAEEPA